MTTKNLATAPASEPPADEAKAAPSTSIAAQAPMAAITLSNHLRIGGTDYLPGAKVRVSADYARRLRLQGYVART